MPAPYHGPEPLAGRLPGANSARAERALLQASMCRYLKMWILPFKQTCRRRAGQDLEAPPRPLLTRASSSGTAGHLPSWGKQACLAQARRGVQGRPSPNSRAHCSAPTEARR